jgi:hypothetical protein
MRRAPRHPVRSDLAAAKGVREGLGGHNAARRSMRARISSTRHAVIRGPNLTGFG